jgi:hypothetical protein
VFIRVHEQLNGLPSNEAIWAKRGYCGGFVGTFRRLKTVETSEGLVDEREGLGFGLEKEWIVVTTDLAIERGEAVWSEIASWVRVERGLHRPVSMVSFYPRLSKPSISIEACACLTINCAMPRHSCSNSGAGLLSGLISVPQWLVAEAMAGRGLARSESEPGGSDER